jgi:hypothetical protein
MQYANFGQVGPTAIENAGGTNQFLEMAKQAAINTLQRAASSKPNSNSSFGLGGIDKLKSDVNQASAQTPQWTAKDNADVESLKMTAQKMNYPTFVNYLQQQPISDYVKQALEGWAKKFYNVK